MEIFKTVNGLGATVGYSVIANNAVLAQFDNFDDALKFSQATPPAPTFDKLTKANKRAVIDARAFIRHGNLDSAARLVSFCIRASLRKAEKAELLYFAKFHKIDINPEFIC
jgi:hypothetical protein